MGAEQYLIQAQELAESIREPDTVVVDCRHDLQDPDLGRNQYLEEHIPGAIFASLDSDLAAPPGIHGRHPLPSKSEFAETLESWGISNRSFVISYDNQTSMFACRLWWMLRWLGHNNVAVLDGGFAAWKSAGLSTSSEIPEPQTVSFSVGTQLTRTVTADEVLAHNDVLLDARAEDRFHGMNETIDHKAGHIPNAQCSPFAANVDQQGKFILNPDKFKQVAQDADIICYCGSGVSATHNVLALLLAGYSEPALYPGSWSEWIEDPTRPIAV